MLLVCPSLRVRGVEVDLEGDVGESLSPCAPVEVLLTLCLSRSGSGLSVATAPAWRVPRAGARVWNVTEDPSGDSVRITNDPCRIQLWLRGLCGPRLPRRAET